MEERLESVAADIRGVRQHMAALMTSHQNADMALIKARLDRIERRLDLAD